MGQGCSFAVLFLLWDVGGDINLFVSFLFTYLGSSFISDIYKKGNGISQLRVFSVELTSVLLLQLSVSASVFT